MPRQAKSASFRRWLVGLGVVVLLAAAVLAASHVTAHLTVNREIERIRAAGEPTTAEELAAFFPKPAGPNAADHFRRAADRFTSPNAIPLPAQLKPLIEQQHEHHENIRSKREAEMDEKAEGHALETHDHPADEGPPSRSDTLEDIVPIAGLASLPEDQAEPLSSLALEASNRFLEHNAEVIDLIIEGSRMDSAWWPSPFAERYDSDTPYRVRIRWLIQLMIVRALVAAEQNDIDSIVESVKCIAALARSLEHRPTLYDYFRHVRFRATLYRALDRIMSRRLPWTSSQLEDLKYQLATLQQPALLHDALMVERVYWIRMRDGRDIRHEFPPEHRLTGISRRAPSYLLHYQGHMISAAQHPPAERRSHYMAIKDDVGALPDRYNPVKQVLIAVTASVATDLRGMACMRTAYTALAIKCHRLEHDTLPDSLVRFDAEHGADMLLDPFDGEPLRFRPTGEGFKVYSIGENMEDQDGTRLARAKDGDIVFSVGMEHAGKGRN